MSLPAYYILNKAISPEDKDQIQRVFAITPIFCAIITDPMDISVVFPYSDHVIRTNSEEGAFALAQAVSEEKNMPVLVVGTADVMDCVYRDGTRDKVIYGEAYTT